MQTEQKVSPSVFAVTPAWSLNSPPLSETFLAKLLIAAEMLERFSLLLAGYGTKVNAGLVREVTKLTTVGATIYEDTSFGAEIEALDEEIHATILALEQLLHRYRPETGQQMEYRRLAVRFRLQARKLSQCVCQRLSQSENYDEVEGGA